MQILFQLAIVGIVIYVGIGVFLYFFQSGLLFYPDSTIAGTPQDAGLNYEQISFTASDGTALSAWFIPSGDTQLNKGTILFCHGNAGNISHRIEYIKMFYSLGLDVFIFDYRGYGESEGKPDEEGLYRDAEAAWNYLTVEKGIVPENIIIFGRSLGGAVGAWLAKDRSPGALVLESTFTSIVDMGAETYRFLPVRLMSRFRFNTVEYMQNVSVPVLVIHSRGDDLIPFHHGERVFAAASYPKEFLEISGSHNNALIVSSQTYTDGLDSFISMYSKQH